MRARRSEYEFALRHVLDGAGVGQITVRIDGDSIHVHFVVPVRIGEVKIVSDVPEAAVREAIRSALA